VVHSGKSLAELCRGMEKYPQKLVNVRLDNQVDVMGSPVMQQAVKEAESELGSEGRIVLRPSGTEPLIRVMVEASSESQVTEITSGLAGVVREIVAAG
jgi:phosphoglucosamine mutase